MTATAAATVDGDTRNVVDHYKRWETEQIIADR